MNAARSLRLRGLVVVGVIVGICVVGFLRFWSSAGGTLPWDDDTYRVSFTTTDVKNLQPAGEVRIAGVKVGTIASTEIEGGSATVTLDLDRDVAPLHEGVTVRVGVKSVIGQSFVAVEDGDGPELDDGARLAADAVVPAVDIDEVVATFDPETRASLADALTSLGASTDGTSEQLSAVMAGLGDLGREGYTAVDAVAAQGEDLRLLVSDATTILDALDTGRSDLTTLVGDAQTVTQTVAGQREDLEATMRALPGLMASADTALGTLGGLGEDLSPVATSLSAAAPDLGIASQDLPAVTEQLRALLPFMDSALGRADETLTPVPELAANLSAIAPDVDVLLRDVNPMVDYLSPYATDIGTFFGNFGSSFDGQVENGVRPVRLSPIFSEYSVRGNPLRLLEINPLHWNNPYPAPGAAEDPQPYQGTYPRVEREE
ncbi:MlaD family protein [Nocardioides zeae]|uniref:MCE family protein n=1 Tax=Nocardioides zeae TaxID=1457234 RepID=A0A6P0HGV2_9ACTN|nr:MlaD family protein [Nocardioides zeae]NEN77868.1 MCE family protein [Nocardioides zeae]